MLVTPATKETARQTLAVEPPASPVSLRQPEAGTTGALSAYLRETLPLDLGELAQDVVAQMLTEGRLNDVDIHYHLSDETVSVDLPRRQFAQILEHLVAS